MDDEVTPRPEPAPEDEKLNFLLITLKFDDQAIYFTHIADHFDGIPGFCVKSVHGLKHSKVRVRRVKCDGTASVCFFIERQ